MLQELIKQRLSQKSEVVDIITFAESQWGLNITLFPAQKFILKVMHGMPLDRQEKVIKIYADEIKSKIRMVLTEAEYLQFLKDEGRISPTYEEGQTRRETVLAIGRRGSKTRLSSVIIVYNIYKLLSMYNPQEYYKVPETDKIGFAAIATSQDQARELFTPVRAGVVNSGFIDDSLIRGSSETEMKLVSRFDHDKKGDKAIPSIWAMAYPCTGRGPRGAANMVIVFDEFAHFVVSGAKSDQEVYKGATPAVASFGKDGKIISISSPLSKSGKFYELFEKGMGENPDILSIQAPCWEINEKLDSDTLMSEYRKDPDSYLNEFGAQWSGHVMDFIRDPDVFRRNINPNRKAATRGERRQAYFMGLDLGAVNDSVAIAISHAAGPKIIVDLIEEIEPPRVIAHRDGLEISPEEGEIQFDEIAEKCNSYCQLFNIRKGYYDHWNGYGFSQSLAKFGLRNTFEMVQFSRSMNSQIYKLLKRLLYENRIEFYPHPKFEEQFLLLQETKLSKHEIKVEAPSGDNNHDDLADAVVRSVILCFETMAADKCPILATTVDGVVIKDHRNPLQDFDSNPAVSLRQYHRRRQKVGGVNPRYERLALSKSSRGKLK